MYTLCNFTGQEFLPPEIWDIEGASGLSHIDDRILQTADQVREFFGVPVTINNWHTNGPFQYRGFRTPNCPLYIAGSMHSCGKAIDLDVQGITAPDVRLKIMANADKFPFIMRLEKNVPGVHLDIKGIDDIDRESIYLFSA